MATLVSRSAKHELPAFHWRPSCQIRSFTSTTSHRSNIGSAPLTIPQSVNFSILPPEIPKAGIRQLGRVQAMPTAVVKGPLGELRMSIPQYVKIEHDETTRKATVGILDRNDSKQRAMWGSSTADVHWLAVDEADIVMNQEPPELI